MSGGHSLHETSTVLVETVTKATSSVGGSYSALPKFSSDASKVVARGPGLTKAFVGQKNTFTVDCSKAGGYPGGPGQHDGAWEKPGETGSSELPIWVTCPVFPKGRQLRAIPDPAVISSRAQNFSQTRHWLSGFFALLCGLPSHAR